MAEISGQGLDQGAVMALITQNMPQPASSTPPGVADASSAGVAAPYARGDHTHASKARKAIATIQSNVATFTWVYPPAFGAGVVPICNAIAQTPGGNTDLINVQIDGTPTNTQCVFRITRYSQSFLSLLGINILGVNSAAITITLHMLALEP